MELYLITFICLIIAFVIFIVSTALRGLRGDYCGTEEETAATLDEPIELPPADAVGATVVSKQWEIVKIGKHTGEVAYFVAFLTDNGERIEHEVSKEMFEKCIEGDTGMLVTVEGKFFDFSDGEDVEEGEKI